MTITVNFRELAGLRAQSTTTTEQIRIDSQTTVSMLIRQLLVSDGGGLEEHVFCVDGSFRNDIAVLVNGRNVNLCGGPHRVLKDGDMVLVVPVIGGG